jgi:hypothetical protein
MPEPDKKKVIDELVGDPFLPNALEMNNYINLQGSVI